MNRVKVPTGVFVCIVSPDGGGKSTVSKAVLSKLLGAFRKVVYFHWRPGLLPKLRLLVCKSESDPQFSICNSDIPYRQARVISLLRWLYYSLDYIIGYYFKLLPLKIRTTAIIFDRYYYDIIIDPARYGFNLPMRLMKLILPLIPKPDLTIYLDNTPECLHERKCELPVAELNRQLEAWRKFIPKLENSRVVTTDKLPGEVVNEVTNMIITKRSEMTEKTLKTDPQESFYLWKSDIAKNYVAIPSKTNCRWIVPTNPILARKTWDLYQPYSFAGRIFKDILKFSSGRGFLNNLTPNVLSLEFSDGSEKLRLCIERLFNRNNLSLALSMGTPGAFRKLTALIMAPDAEILGCLKIARTPLAIERIKNEAEVLRNLKVMIYQKPDSRIRIPACLYEGELDTAHFIILSPPPFIGKKGTAEFDDQYAEILAALIQRDFLRKRFSDSIFYKNLLGQIDDYPLSFKGIYRNGLDSLKNSMENMQEVFCLSHGDFAPWNILWKDKQAFIFDWESGYFEAPAGIDYIHFLFQTGFLLKGLRGKKLLNFVTKNEPHQILSNKLGHALLKPEILLLSYLLKMAVEQDNQQLLFRSSVERRNLIGMLIENGHSR